MAFQIRYFSYNFNQPANNSDKIQDKSQKLSQQLKFFNNIPNQIQILFMNSQPLANPFIKIKANSMRTYETNKAEQMESECPSCGKTGTTNILLVSIPLFREIMICSFSCPHCGENNKQVQFAGRLPDYGISILFRCFNTDDLNRQVIRSEHCTLEIQELELTLPPNKRSEITTIESILLRVKEDLRESLKNNNLGEEHSTKMVAFLEKLQLYSTGLKFPVTLKLTDPSGNSNIKNPFAPSIDKHMEIRYFKRTLNELKEMGYSIENAQAEVKHEKQSQHCGDKLNFVLPFQQKNFMKYEPVQFQIDCEVCHLPGKLVTCRTSVPYFTELVIMSFSCEHCGYHNTQTKNSSQIGQQALVITLRADGQADMKRDLFKSQTCYVEIPQLELELDYGTLGGIFTTVEGLLEKIHDHLGGHNPFVDSDNEFSVRMKAMLSDMKEMQNGKKPFTLRLVDPLARSFLQNPYVPAEDRNATKFLRDRTYDEMEMLGLNDMKVENYQS